MYSSPSVGDTCKEHQGTTENCKDRRKIVILKHGNMILPQNRLTPSVCLENGSPNCLHFSWVSRSGRNKFPEKPPTSIESTVHQSLLPQGPSTIHHINFKKGVRKPFKFQNSSSIHPKHLLERLPNLLIPTLESFCMSKPLFNLYVSPSSISFAGTCGSLLHDVASVWSPHGLSVSFLAKALDMSGHLKDGLLVEF